MNKEQVLAQLDIPAFFGQELERLSSPKENGEATALCPFHADKNPSLSVNFKTGEHFCHACHAKGDIFSFMQERYSLDFPQAVERLASFAGIGPEDAPAKPARKQLPKCPVNKRNLKENLAVHYCYHDVDHSELFYILRYEKPGYQKDILQGRMVDGKMTLGLNGMRPTIYRLPEVSAASFVVVVEGENKAEALASLGICATCNPGGAGKWKAEYAAHFQGKGIVILPDNDEPGRKHAEQVAASLHGVAAYVKICDLPGLPLAGDIIDWLEVPGNDRERLQALMNDSREWRPQDAKPEPENAGFYTVLSGKELLALPSPIWRVKGVFPECGTVVVHGISRSGKTFTVLDLALAATLGREWFGFKTVACDVLYICLESAWGLQRRLRAWTIHNSRALPEGLRFIIEPFDLRDKNNVRAICQLAPRNGVLVIDTLNRATPGADENSSKDMSQIIAAAGEIQAAMQGLVLLVAHSGKDTAKGIRGHSSLFAALDANIEVGRNGDSRFIKLDKVKEAEDGAKKHFRLKPVSVGQDEDGEPITSCVVEPLDGPGADGSEDKPLSGALRYAIDSLDKALEEEAAPSIHIDTWRTYFYAGHSADNDEAKQKAFQRARRDLVERGKIAVFNDRYSRTDRTFTGQVRQLSGPLQADRTGHTPLGVSGCPAGGQQGPGQKEQGLFLG